MILIELSAENDGKRQKVLKKNTESDEYLSGIMGN